MATYLDVVNQINNLTKEAEKIRRHEVRTVINDIKRQISLYGLTARDLGLLGASSSAKGTVVATDKTGNQKRRSGAPRAAKRSVPPKYHDGLGNFWTGRGKRPRWVTEALANGRSIDSLLMNSN